MASDTPEAQAWDPESYAANARFVSDLGEPLIALLQPLAGERVLDVGCGDGALTERLAALGCVVLAIDASEAQVRGARARGIEALTCRVEELPFADPAAADRVVPNERQRGVGAAEGEQARFQA